MSVQLQLTIRVANLSNLTQGIATKKDLVIKEDKNGRGIFVQGAMEVYVSSVEDVFELMKKGSTNRVTGSTRMNIESSRSHSIFVITLTQKDIVKMESKSGKLFLVDLAGSEKVKKTRAEGKLLEEAKNINKSLSALGNVINAYVLYCSIVNASKFFDL